MSVFGKVQASFLAGRAVWVATVIGASGAGQEWLSKMMALDGDVLVEQLIDGVFTRKVVDQLQQKEDEKPEVLAIEHNGEVYKVFVECWQREPEMLVLGGGHISQPLVTMLGLSGFRVTVVDDRPEFANRNRFPEAEEVVCGDFIKTLQGLGAERFQGAVIVTRGHRHDLDCLREMLQRPLRYLGMIGSKRRVAGVIQMLEEEGTDLTALRALHSPIGLDLGAQTPGEIALSIAAEIVGEMKGGSFMPLSRKREM